MTTVMYILGLRRFLFFLKIDDDPKNPSYIAAQSPLDETCEDFWQMIWQTDCAVIVSLCSKSELENDMCTKYWPDADYVVYGKFEVDHDS
jgi:receptor-type tyrosine-protein phosphatase N